MPQTTCVLLVARDWPAAGSCGCRPAPWPSRGRRSARRLSRSASRIARVGRRAPFARSQDEQRRPEVEADARVVVDDARRCARSPSRMRDAAVGRVALGGDALVPVVVRVGASPAARSPRARGSRAAAGRSGRGCRRSGCRPPPVRSGSRPGAVRLGDVVGHHPVGVEDRAQVGDRSSSCGPATPTAARRGRGRRTWARRRPRAASRATRRRRRPAAARRRRGCARRWPSRTAWRGGRGPSTPRPTTRRGC